jgi:hypothetical protein
VAHRFGRASTALGRLECSRTVAEHTSARAEEDQWGRLVGPERHGRRHVLQGLLGAPEPEQGLGQVPECDDRVRVGSQDGAGGPLGLGVPTETDQPSNPLLPSVGISGLSHAGIM